MTTYKYIPDPKAMRSIIVPKRWNYLQPTKLITLFHAFNEFRAWKCCRYLLYDIKEILTINLIIKSFKIEKKTDARRRHLKIFISIKFE